jgi:hypothetical protein
MSALKRAERNIRQSLKMQLKDTEVEHLLDQHKGLFREMLRVTERKHHSDRHAVGESLPGSEIDDEEILQANNHVVNHRKHNSRAAEARVRADDVAAAILLKKSVN